MGLLVPRVESSDTRTRLGPQPHWGLRLKHELTALDWSVQKAVWSHLFEGLLRVSEEVAVNIVVLTLETLGAYKY